MNISVDGSQMDSYLARPPEGSGPHPAVIVLQEIFGVNAEMRRVTDLLAGAGYVGLAINYYHRTHPNLNVKYDEAGAQTGIQAAKSVSRATIYADLGAAMDWLKGQAFVRDGMIATWGFCMGGSVAFLSATLPDVDGAICFYGGQIARPFHSGDPEALAEADSIRAPLLLCFGAEDKGIPPDAIERIRRELDARGKEYLLEVYPGVGHAFFRAVKQDQYSDEAIATATADSWNLVQKFLGDCFSRG
ncbi:MAG TPA: dienelactone hydrolase family protein [Candidatus Rubrimentiphilum sp.]|nr:dienelactone hydrolase family protein [Candidatus Rubrimentiphilum sp.]